MPLFLRPRLPRRSALDLLVWGLLAALTVAVAPAAAQTVPSSPAYYDPAGGDGTRGTADDDYRPDRNNDSDLINAGQTGVGLTDQLDIDGDSDTSEPIPGSYNTSSFTGDSEATISYAPSSGDALPVELTSINATYTSNTERLDDDNVRLAWQTASETNNAGFNVQQQTRSGYQTIEFVDGHGTTTKPHSYDINVDAPNQDVVTYRLEQVDADGTTTFSDPVTVDIPVRDEIRTGEPRPNPTSGPVRIPYNVPPSQDTDQDLTVYNTLGQEVQTVDLAPGRGTHQVDTDNLSSGTYFIRTANGNDTDRFTIIK